MALTPLGKTAVTGAALAVTGGVVAVATQQRKAGIGLLILGGAIGIGAVIYAATKDVNFPR
jgi:curli biogenesis system outer membrane secretion channel CsgG